MAQARRCSRVRSNELEQRCSCPDWEVPCKHLAATFYLLAEAFDDGSLSDLALAWTRPGEAVGPTAGAADGGVARRNVH